MVIQEGSNINHALPSSSQYCANSYSLGTQSTMGDVQNPYI